METFADENIIAVFFLFYDCVNFRLLLLEPLWRTINFSLKGKLIIYYSSLRHCCCVYGQIYKAPASWPLILLYYTIYTWLWIWFFFRIKYLVCKYFFKCKISDSYITSKTYNVVHLGMKVANLAESYKYQVSDYHYFVCNEHFLL